MMTFQELWQIIVNALFKESSDAEEYKEVISDLQSQVDDLKKQLSEKDVKLGSKQAEIDSMLNTISGTVEALNSKNPTPVTDAIIQELNSSPTSPVNNLPTTVNTPEVTPVEVSSEILNTVPSSINLGSI